MLNANGGEKSWPREKEDQLPTWCRDADFSQPLDGEIAKPRAKQARNDAQDDDLQEEELHDEVLLGTDGAHGSNFVTRSNVAMTIELLMITNATKKMMKIAM